MTVKEKGLSIQQEALLKADVPLPTGPYVYALVDQAGATFYIGKGRGLRMFAHVYEARRGEPGAKCDRIRAILAGGDSVRYLVLGAYQTDVDAGAAEREFIAKTPGLCNVMTGGQLGGLVLPARERLRRDAANVYARIPACNRGHFIAKLLLKEAQNPTPNMVTQTPAGVVFSWWYDDTGVKEFRQHMKNLK